MKLQFSAVIDGVINVDNVTNNDVAKRLEEKISKCLLKDPELSGIIVDNVVLIEGWI